MSAAGVKKRATLTANTRAAEAKKQDAAAARSTKVTATRKKRRA
jgi:hypothetical protein